MKLGSVQRVHVALGGSLALIGLTLDQAHLGLQPRELSVAVFRIAGQGIEAHELGKFEEIGDAPGAFEGLVDACGIAGDIDFMPEAVAEARDFLESFLEAGAVAGHPAVIPEDAPEGLVEIRNGPFATDLEESGGSRPDVIFDVGEVW